uniref:V-type proton ATPase subunit C n=1 Tax=Scleropages formosus TaxID=113540 RepID=A0A8C9VXN6_SCLFO
MAQSLLEVTEQSRDKVLENALANRVDPVSYVTHFRWDRAKYPTSLPLKGLTELISKQMSQVQTELKSRGAAYANLKASLQKVECRADLQTRTLTDIVKKEDLVLDSEYLTTLLVVVPRERFLQWNESYESLSEFVVPRSSRKVLDEAEGGIFTVTLFKKAVVDFKAAAKQNSFAVRDFAFADLERQQQESLRLAAEMKEQHVRTSTDWGLRYDPASPFQATFVLWLKVNFSEIFAASIHVKAIRVFVESVLRYGLPVNFQALLLQPDKKSSKKLRALLNSLFAHLDPSAAATKADARVDIPGLSMAPPDYYSYICYKIDISMVAS